MQNWLIVLTKINDRYDSEKPRQKSNPHWAFLYRFCFINFDKRFNYLSWESDQKWLEFTLIWKKKDHCALCPLIKKAAISSMTIGQQCRDGDRKTLSFKCLLSCWAFLSIFWHRSKVNEAAAGTSMSPWVIDYHLFCSMIFVIFFSKSRSSSLFEHLPKVQHFKEKEACMQKGVWEGIFVSRPSFSCWILNNYRGVWGWKIQQSQYIVLPSITLENTVNLSQQHLSSISHIL